MVADLRRLVDEILELVREEFALARVEISAKIRLLVAGLVLFALAAVLLVLVGLVATSAAILGLSTVVAPWLAALIVAGAYLLVALICVLIGRSSVVKALPPIPTQTIATIKENLLWAKTLTTSKRT